MTIRIVHGWKDDVIYVYLVWQGELFYTWKSLLEFILIGQSIKASSQTDSVEAGYFLIYRLDNS